MKILVFAHKFEVGGSQRNAIDLSEALRDVYGHDIVIFATPGPMVKVAEEKGIRFISAPQPKAIPSFAMMRALLEVVRCERPDLIHVWDWWQCMDAFYSVHLFDGIPMVVSDMISDGITRLLPKSICTTFGTPEFVDLAKAAGRSRTELLLPPVDIHLNAPEIVDPRQFRELHNIDVDDVVLVTVSRLAVDLKSESLRRTIQAVGVLGRELRLKFFIVGDGNARNDLKKLADETNSELGRSAVVLTGEMIDPRPAYAAADIVIGMGGSALRGMAFGKPIIIVGARGFSAPLTPETAEFFYYYGIYGIGDGSPNNERLIGDIRTLVGDKDKLQKLGEFSRQFVLDNFALETVCSHLDRYCRIAAAERRQPLVAVVDGLRTFALLKLGKYVPDSVRRLLKSLNIGRTL